MKPVKMLSKAMAISTALAACSALPASANNPVVAGDAGFAAQVAAKDAVLVRAKALEGKVRHKEAAGCARAADEFGQISYEHYEAALPKKMKLRSRYAAALDSFYACQMRQLKAAMIVTEEDMAEMGRIKTAIEGAPRLRAQKGAYEETKALHRELIAQVRALSESLGETSDPNAAKAIVDEMQEMTHRVNLIQALLFGSSLPAGITCQAYANAWSSGTGGLTDADALTRLDQVRAGLEAEYASKASGDKLTVRTKLLAATADFIVCRDLMIEKQENP